MFPIQLKDFSTKVNHPKNTNTVGINFRLICTHRRLPQIENMRNHDAHVYIFRLEFADKMNRLHDRSLKAGTYSGY